MHIVAGTLRGRRLIAPKGSATRPSSVRLRQALFDILLHAPWGGPDWLQNAHVLDVFAGTGALGLEALSRGARYVEFFEQDLAAIQALRHNIDACGMNPRTRVHSGDACHPAPGPPADLVLLDPPYGHGLVDQALHAFATIGRLSVYACIAIEIGKSDPEPGLREILTDRRHGAGRILIGRPTGP